MTQQLTIVTEQLIKDALNQVKRLPVDPAMHLRLITE